MSEQGLLICTFVLAAAAFGVSLWALALGLLNAERRKEEAKHGALDRLVRGIQQDKFALDVCAKRLEKEPDSLAARREYDESAARLAESYEDLCEALVHMRHDAETRLYRAYGDEIRTWVEEGPLRDSYRWRVPRYPATTEIWRTLRAAASRPQEERRSA